MNPVLRPPGFGDEKRTPVRSETGEHRGSVLYIVLPLDPGYKI